MAKPAGSLANARAAQRKISAQLARVREVNGIGITREGKGFALKVNLVSRPKPGTTIPTQVDGIPVRVEVVGQIRAR